ncbi:MAG: DUF983 domain-containing protein [Acidimicrobiales bacterium]
MRTPDDYVPQPPAKKTLFRRGLLVRCPACGDRHVFTSWFRMKPRCDSCGLVFERIAGHWTGAIGISIIISFPLLAIVLIGSIIATAPDIKTTPIVIAGVLVGIFVPLLIFPLTRTLWTALDIMMRPLRADEVDWSAAGENPPNQPD